jgi:hypothetical protein
MCETGTGQQVAQRLDCYIMMMMMMMMGRFFFRIKNYQGF